MTISGLLLFKTEHHERPKWDTTKPDISRVPERAWSYAITARHRQGGDRMMLRCMSPEVALFGPQEFSDLSPRYARKRTLSADPLTDKNLDRSHVRLS